MQTTRNAPHAVQKLIVPPGLQYLIRAFENHVSMSGGAPIMICGPTGVGQSLFLHLYKQLCREKMGPDCHIDTVNCAHFSGDLARSELFGHVRGSFTGAVRNKHGWIRRANNAVLVLEEVGDLPRETQATLLTFVETLQFHRVGSRENESTDVRIIAATNRHNQLRKDFRNRFFRFSIPPLCERRQDILYYMAHAFPELINALTPCEILVLLTYNWPGNVREVEYIGRLLISQKMMHSQEACPSWDSKMEKLLESDIFGLPEANSILDRLQLKKDGLLAISPETTDLEAWNSIIKFFISAAKI